MSKHAIPDDDPRAGDARADTATLRRLVAVDALKAAAAWRAYQDRAAALARTAAVARGLGLGDAELAAELAAAGVPAEAISEPVS